VKPFLIARRKLWLDSPTYLSNVAGQAVFQWRSKWTEILEWKDRYNEYRVEGYWQALQILALIIAPGCAKLVARRPTVEAFVGDRKPTRKTLMFDKRSNQRHLSCRAKM
jgi:hypothetical protein